ncbi:hypothetical protein [Metasolibacillus meyeri]|uniref:hypothetical protein n=1 Tax=Metasolibacillus meyeri TaxID=1071052 RepID=UPI000D31D95F|nr:hypothetical protein [Metasolibacillus meyeri]
MNDKDLQHAFGVWEELSQTPESRITYESRLKYILDEEAGKKDAHAAGVKEGIEKGLERALEQTAINMIKEGTSDEFIIKVIGLSFEKVQQLRNKQL